MRGNREDVGLPVTISGTNFVGGGMFAVDFGFGGVDVVSATVVDSSTIDVILDISAGATLNGRRVVVFNADGQRAELPFAFFVDRVAPTLTSVSPTSGLQGASLLTVILRGTGLVPNAVVSFSGVGVLPNAPTLNNSTQLTFVISIDPTAPPGVRDVTVLNPDGQTATLMNAFTVVAPPPAPTITSLNPTSGEQGANGLPVTITGTDFVGGGSFGVNFGAGITVASATVTSPTTIAVTLNIASDAILGDRDVTVTNVDGQATTAPNAFTVVAPPSMLPPTITGPLTDELARLFYLTTVALDDTANAFGGRSLESISDAVLAASDDPDGDNNLLKVFTSIDGGTFTDLATGSLALTTLNAAIAVQFLAEDEDTLRSTTVALTAYLLFPALDFDGDGATNRLELEAAADPVIGCGASSSTNLQPDVWAPDFNGDGIVGLRDLIILAMAFNSDVNSPRFNPRVNLSFDNRIDGDDLQVFAAFFNTVCP